jgi:transcriptional regulator with XRE-family HTH domain
VALPKANLPGKLGFVRIIVRRFCRPKTHREQPRLSNLGAKTSLIEDRLRKNSVRLDAIRGLCIMLLAGAISQRSGGVQTRPVRRQTIKGRMSDDVLLKDDLIQLRKDMGLTQQQMANAFDMALRAYQSIESGESEYRHIHRLAAERVALMMAAQKKEPMLAPQPVRDDAIEVVRVGRLTGEPAFQKARAKEDARTDEKDDDHHNARFRAAYGTVGELVLLATALDHQLNHVLILVLHLAESPMLEAVIATLDTVRKIEMLKERTKFITQTNWQKPVLSYVNKLERVSRWRNIACHTPLIPDDEHGAVFIVTAAAKLLKTLQLGTGPVAKPYAELRSAISLGETALSDGLNLIDNFKKLNAERKKRFG